MKLKLIVSMLLLYAVGLQSMGCSGGETTIEPQSSDADADSTMITQPSDDTEAPEESVKWVQDHFIHGTGYNHLYDTQQVRAAQEAGYNLFLFEYYASKNLDLVERTVEVCEEIGMPVLIGEIQGGGANSPEFSKNQVRYMIDTYSEYKSVIGYHIWDEMLPPAFDNGKLLHDWIRQYAPGSLVWSCLIPSYGPLAWDPKNQEESEYVKYVDDYLKMMDPDILCFDYYPFELGGSTIKTHGWYMDMGLYRTKALEYDKPFWYWYQVIEHNTEGEVLPEAKIRVGIYTGLAYGAKGLHPWTSQSYAYERDGSKSERFEECMNLNAEIMNVGQFMFDKTGTAIYHTGLPDKSFNVKYYLDDLDTSDLIASAPDDLILSVFEDDVTQNRYLMVVNKNHSVAQTGTLTLKMPCEIARFDAESNTVVSVGDSMNEIELNLSAGNGVVYILMK